MTQQAPTSETASAGADAARPAEIALALRLFELQARSIELFLQLRLGVDLVQGLRQVPEKALGKAERKCEA